MSHFPPGTSKWNKIEHRLFSFISQNWRGKPLISHEVIVNLIAATTTATGLRVRAELDTATYPVGRKVRKQGVTEVNLYRDSFHGEWNYTIWPRKKIRESITCFVTVPKRAPPRWSMRWRARMHP